MTDVETTAAWSRVPASLDALFVGGPSDISSEPVEAKTFPSDWNKARFVSRLKMVSDESAARANSTFASLVESLSDDTEAFRRHVRDSFSDLTTMHRVKQRLQNLRVLAATDGEPYRVSSERHLFAFLQSVRHLRKPDIFLVANGNLRAVWKNAIGEQVGMEFLGDDEVQFVIFARRPTLARMARIAGRDSTVAASSQINTLGVSRLLVA